MEQKKRILSIALTFILTFMMLLNSNAVQASEKKAIIPMVNYVNEPTLEYTAGDTVNFNLHSPNYGGRVQYRVVLWDNNKKEARDLWAIGDRYYTGWIPYGNNSFNLHWRIDEPGSYRITVYVKRAGIQNSITALKGQNCDSYLESQAFVVKAKATALDKDGQTYGSIDKNKIEAYKNNINITAKNVTFNNASIEGNLAVTGNNAVIRNVNVLGRIVIDPGKDGSCTLDNVTAKEIRVLSGGQNSIHIRNSNAEAMNVNSQSTVRIEVDGDTEIVSTSASGYVIFDRKNGTYGTITITKAENGESVVEFRGDIKDKVEVEAAATIRTGQGSSIANLVVNTENSTDIVRLEGQYNNVEIASSAKLEVAANTKVENIVANNDAEIKLDKTATITKVEKNDNEVVIIGEDSVGTNTPPENNDGGYVPPTVTVRAINVTSAGNATMVVNGGTLQMSAAITPANAANKTITWSITNGTGSATINANGLLTATGVGTVTVKAKNPASNVIGSLVITVSAPDKTALTAAINAEYTDGAARTMKVLAETDYTALSWKAYTDAITAAITVESDANAIQQEVDNAAAAIGTAKGNLVFAGKAGLEIAKTAASGKAQADYTAASWANLAAALTLPETTNTEVVAKTAVINIAINNLVFAGKADLEAAKTAASGKVQADYTANSWTAFSNAMTTANGLPETTNTEVIEKTTAINIAISKLVFAGIADLDAAKTAANGKVQADYTAASWANLAAALVLPETSNAEVVAKTTAINNAIGLLVKKGDKTALTAAINAEYTDGAARTTKVLAEADYTTASWTAYTNAITAAIAVESDANAIQQQVDNAVAAIGTAKTALVFANKAALDAAVAALDTTKEEKYYTAASWADFISARNAALAMQQTTNSEMGAKAAALNSAIALLVEKVPEILNSIAVTNFNYETLYATQARIESKVITTSNFGPGNNKSFTVTDSSGNVIPVNLTWNIPATVNDLPATYATVVGSAVESTIQQYFVDKGGSAGLSNRTLWASGSGDKFSIGAFGVGPTGKITISGPDASYFFDTLQATGTGDDYSKNRTFTVSDGTNISTITLSSSYTNMTNLVNSINSMLGATKAVAVKIDESHFKLVAKEVWIHLTIEGVNKADFFSSFESQ